MVSEFFLWLGSVMVDWLIGLFPDWDVPADFESFDTTVNGFLASFGGVGVWAPWVLMIACAGIALAAWLIGLAIKAVRAIAAHIPLIGGAG